MARALLIAHRRPGRLERFEADVALLNRRLTPDNIVTRAPERARDDRIGAAIFNPGGAACLHGTSIRLGVLLDNPADWHKPGTAPPDGSYALLRTDTRRIELVADAVASRTVWYILTSERFIASTSQRAIVSLLGDFTPNPCAVPWMLSSGTLGPEGGWDARLRQLQPGERLVLNRSRWTLSHDFGSLDPEPDSGGAAPAARLAATLETVGRRLDLDTSKWVLPLSGGVDSRGLLCLLRERPGIQTITWGVSSAHNDIDGDVRVAREVAAAFGVRRRFFTTDLSDEPKERLIQRFLTAGEGRVAKISGYVDGFAVWKTLHDEGIEGIIRGDEAFGSRRAVSAASVRYLANLSMLSDYFGAEARARFELPDQTLPQHLARRPRETLPAWRDRLYQTFRLPKLLAGLTDLKTAYTEVVNPLLTREILACVRGLPDQLRTEKRLWRELVRSRSPNIRYANRPAVLPLESFLRDRPMLELMLAEMESGRAEALFNSALRRELRAGVIAELESDGSRRAAQGPRARLAGIAPESVKRLARRWTSEKPALHPIVLAFRAFITSRMHARLKSDAEGPVELSLSRAANS